MSKAKQSVRKVVAANLEALRANRGWTKSKLEAESGVTHRYIDKILKEEVDCSPPILYKLAGAFDLPGYMLLLPGLKIDMLDSGKIPKLFEDFSRSGPKDQELVTMMASRGADLAKPPEDDDEDDGGDPPPKPA